MSGPNTGVMEQILYVVLDFAPTLAALQAAWKIANMNEDAQMIPARA